MKMLRFVPLCVALLVLAFLTVPSPARAQCSSCSAGGACSMVPPYVPILPPILPAFVPATAPVVQPARCVAPAPKKCWKQLTNLEGVQGYGTWSNARGSLRVERYAPIDACEQAGKPSELERQAVLDAVRGGVHSIYSLEGAYFDATGHYENFEAALCSLLNDGKLKHTGPGIVGVARCACNCPCPGCTCKR